MISEPRFAYTLLLTSLSVSCYIRDHAVTDSEDIWAEILLSPSGYLLQRYTPALPPPYFDTYAQPCRITVVYPLGYPTPPSL